MANNKSAEKRDRQSLVRRDRNRQVRSNMRSSIKKLRSALSAADAKTAADLLPRTLQVIDVTARKRIIARNTAARYKSRLSKAVASLASG